MNIRRYPIINQRPVSRWLETDKQLDFGNLNNVPNFKQPVRWIVKAAIWTLKRFGMLKPAKVEYSTVQTITIDYENLERFIMENHHELIRMFGVCDSVVVMGSRAFSELTNQVALTYPMRFEMSDSGGKITNRLRGMLLIVLPWIDGTLLIPKEYMPIDEKIIKVPVPATDEECEAMRKEFEDKKAAALWNDFMGREPLNEE